MNDREQALAAQARAQAAMERTPGALGAIDAAMAYGLNWTELLESREAFAQLIAATRFAIGVDRITDSLKDALARVEKAQ